MHHFPFSVEKHDNDKRQINNSETANTNDIIACAHLEGNNLALS